jgi:nitroreductase
MLTRREMNAGLLAGALLTATSGVALAQEAKAKDLPRPRQEGGKPLMTALKQRHSTREFANKPLTPQQLSDLLWAAFGVNRASGDRTAPTWRHIILIDLYLAMADGAWLYDGKANKLIPVLAEDIRADSGTQDYVATAPLNLIYVAHGEAMGDISDEDKRMWATVNAGFIGQNVYLHCASEGLATVFRASVNRDRVAKLLKLPPQQFVLAGQSVGHPKA